MSNVSALVEVFRPQSQNGRFADFRAALELHFDLPTFFQCFVGRFFDERPLRLRKYDVFHPGTFASVFKDVMSRRDQDLRAVEIGPPLYVVPVRAKVFGARPK